MEEGPKQIFRLLPQESMRRMRHSVFIRTNHTAVLRTLRPTLLPLQLRILSCQSGADGKESMTLRADVSHNGLVDSRTVLFAVTKLPRTMQLAKRMVMLLLRSFSIKITAPYA